MNERDWYQALNAAASTLVQHTLSGPLVIGGVERADLHAVRAEDWDKLQALLDPGAAHSQSQADV